VHLLKLFFFTVFASICVFTLSCGSDTGGDTALPSNITGFMHVNVNCSDLERSRSFYEMLGFISLMADDSEVTAEFAAALNMPPYKLSYTQLILGGALIDLIEWTDPYDGSAPYSYPNHLGIARITLNTANLDEDISTLRDQGVEFFSDPVSINRPHGNERFVCFSDPDGNVIELVETGDSGGSGGFLSVNINCSSIEQSRLFYEMLGFESVADVNETGTSEFAAAFGLPAYQVQGSLMELDTGPAVNLLEWKEPYDDRAPYKLLNHLGMPRIALQTTDLDMEIRRLEAQGVEFFSEPVSPPGLLESLRIVCFKDPDGTVIELVELSF